MNQAQPRRSADDDVLLSLVVPVHNEADGLATFFDRVVPIVEAAAHRYEIVCVNDGSTDDSFAVLQRHRAANPRIRIVDLARNFGKEVALTAGLDYAIGQAVVPLDADLQDPPEVIPDMIGKWREGYDMVLAVRADRSADSAFKRVTARMFYRVIGRVSEIPIPSDAGDFRLMDRRVVDALKRLPERTRFMKGLFAWLGFRQATVTYTRPARVAGNSKWRVWRLWNFALEGILSFTTLPLRVWTYFGLVIATLSLAYMLLIVGRTLLFGADVPGYASLAVMILFFSGLNMIGLGVMGEYLGRVFVEVKQRPLYLVREEMGFEPAGRKDPVQILERAHR